MSKINKILAAVVVILVAVLAGVIFWQNNSFQNSYYAVYLSTGDLYFGHLSRFPSLSLSDIWLLQRNDANSSTSFGITRFDKAFWNPENELQLESKNIIWITKIKSDSQLVKYFDNPEGVQPQASAQEMQPNSNPLQSQFQNLAQQAPASTSTNK